ncbi:MAG: isopenicillin N synthase family dioxygenase [Persicimonas sp.]
MSQNTNDIPVVDINDLTSPRTEVRERAAAAIRRAFGLFGLVYLRNHGVDMGLLDAFYDEFLDFTERAEEEKQKMSTPNIWYQRGWTPPNTEKAVVAGGQPDFKECFFITPNEPDPGLQRQYPEIHASNVWPEDAPRFRESYTEMSRQLQRVGENLLRGCASALGLADHLLETAVDGGPHVTRALRYIPLNEDQVGTDIVWGEEHTDFNLLTILPGGRFLDADGQRCDKPDPDAGLYLRTRASAKHPNGQKIQGETPDGCIVAQVGQQLEILTGGEFLATPHVIEAPQTPGYSRVAMAHFVHLHVHEQLFPLERFQTDETVRGYGPPVMVGTYNLKTLVDIGLAPEEALDRLGYTKYERLGEIRKAESEKVSE